MSAQVAADLRAAADVLERDGWTQGKYHRITGGAVCHCAEGAIAIATGAHAELRIDSSWAAGVAWSIDWDQGRRENACEALERYIGSQADDLWATPEWNDTSGRTAAEVIAALRAAADRAEAES